MACASASHRMTRRTCTGHCAAAASAFLLPEENVDSLRAFRRPQSTAPLILADSRGGAISSAAGGTFPAAPAQEQALRTARCPRVHARASPPPEKGRSEEHTSELQSLMRISYAVFCLNKKQHNT